MQPAQNTHPTLTENPVQIPADSPLEALLTLQRQNAVIIKELKAANGKLTFFVVVLRRGTQLKVIFERLLNRLQTDLDLIDLAIHLLQAI